MGKHKDNEPKNTDVKDAMKLKHPDWVFTVCEVCHNWCVFFPHIEGGFHPTCSTTMRARNILYRRKRENKDVGNGTLFGG